MSNNGESDTSNEGEEQKSQKRKSSALTAMEKELLLLLVKEHIGIIEDKRTDSGQMTGRRKHGWQLQRIQRTKPGNFTDMATTEESLGKFKEICKETGFEWNQNISKTRTNFLLFKFVDCLLQEGSS